DPARHRATVPRLLDDGPRRPYASPHREGAPMNVRRLDKRRIELSEPTFHALQVLAQLDRLTPQEVLERLVLDFLELRWDEASVLELAAPPRPQRPPAKVIDLDTHRSRESLRESRQIIDVMERSRALRAHSERLRARARSMRCTAQQNIRASDQAWQL